MGTASEFLAAATLRLDCRCGGAIGKIL